MTKEEADELAEVKRHYGFMRIARACARMGRAEEVKVGAVLVYHDSILATGWNDETIEPALHAEVACLGSDYQLGVLSEYKGDLYVTTAPCINCTKRIIAIDFVGRVFYQNPWWDKAGAQMLKDAGITVTRLRRLRDSAEN